MLASDDNEMFSRERLAGYDPERIGQATLLVVGIGALGTNVLHTLAFAGVEHIRLCDPQAVSRSNVTRSPLFRRERLTGSQPRSKAREAAISFVELAYADDPKVEYAVAEIEDLGYGALVADVIISCADHDGTRAYLANASRWLGIPLVEAGFSGSRFHVTSFSNRKSSDACWQCLAPSTAANGFSCEQYAARVELEGRIPATQSLAAACGAIVAEAAVQAIHCNYPADGCMLSVNTRTWNATRVQIGRSEHCGGRHERVGQIIETGVRVNEPVSKLLDASGLTAPELEIPPFVVAAPCDKCGAPVHVRRPARHLKSPPACLSCPTTGPDAVMPPHVVTRIGHSNPLVATSCRSLGIVPGTLVEAVDRYTHERRPLRLGGDALSRFSIRTRRHAKPVHDTCSTSIGATGARQTEEKDHE
jgi:molybdopterin/thiamine biosynthesis adenylyltransferase